MTPNHTLKRLQNRLQKRSFVEDKYTSEAHLLDSRFGKIELWSHRGGENLLIMKKRVSQKGEDCLRDIQHARERIKINQDYLMRMVDFSVKVVSLRQFEVWGFYQAPLLDLSREIQSRVQKKR